ncbi:MAG: hypothetical protein H7144_12410 [Burkholderiales bacterium]|nr:hypothetical protein [Phycisphaerae bacterium]
MSKTDPATLYPRAATRSWLEINVRPWLGLTILMSLAVVAMAGVQLYSTLQERRLIQSGTVVQAKVLTIGLAKERNAPRDEVQRVVLEFVDPKSGRTIESLGQLPRKPKAQVSQNQILTIRVDPNDPQVWTERTEPVPILLELTVPLLLFPIALICLAMMIYQRSRVRRTLVDGQTLTGHVVSLQQSAIAPMSKRMGLTVSGDASGSSNLGGQIVRYAYWPARNGPIVVGDDIKVVVSSSGMVLPVRSYM